MILNVSGRTDIVAFYTKWFMNRYKEGFVDVRNPFYPNMVSRIYFDNVDAIVFCTKNPIPIIPFLKEINKPIIFHVTLTPYNKDIEPNVINKGKIIEGIKEISNIIGKDRVYVRYDPIFLNTKYNLDYHKRAFSKMCHLLKGYVSHIIVSFVDTYKNVLKNQSVLQYVKLDEAIYQEIGTFFSEVAKDSGMTVQTCFEKRNLVEYGFIDSPCVSKELALELTGKKYKLWPARKCGCVEMVDIGAYNTCSHFCKYCYANYDEKRVAINKKMHDPNSTMLIGHLTKEDIIKERK